MNTKKFISPDKSETVTVTGSDIARETVVIDLSTGFGTATFKAGFSSEVSGFHVALSSFVNFKKSWQLVSRLASLGFYAQGNGFTGSERVKFEAYPCLNPGVYNSLYCLDLGWGFLIFPNCGDVQVVCKKKLSDTVWDLIKLRNGIVTLLGETVDDDFAKKFLPSSNQPIYYYAVTVALPDSNQIIFGLSSHSMFSSDTEILKLLSMYCGLPRMQDILSTKIVGKCRVCKLNQVNRDIFDIISKTVGSGEHGFVLSTTDDKDVLLYRVSRIGVATPLFALVPCSIDARKHLIHYATKMYGVADFADCDCTLVTDRAVLNITEE